MEKKTDTAKEIIIGEYRVTRPVKYCRFTIDNKQHRCYPVTAPLPSSLSAASEFETDSMINYAADTFYLSEADEEIAQRDSEHQSPSNAFTDAHKEDALEKTTLDSEQVKAKGKISRREKRKAAKEKKAEEKAKRKSAKENKKKTSDGKNVSDLNEDESENTEHTKSQVKKLKRQKYKFSIYEEVDEEKIKREKEIDEAINKDGYYDAMETFDQGITHSHSNNVKKNKIFIGLLVVLAAAIAGIVLILGDLLL